MASWTTSTTASGSQIVTPGATTTYDITCTGTGGAVSASVTVTVGAAPPPPADANLDVAVSAPAQAVDGDDFDVSAVISDLSGNGAASVSVELSWTPDGNLRSRGAALNQTVAVAANGTATVTWTLEGRSDGVTNLVVTATDGATGTVFSGATSVEIIR